MQHNEAGRGTKQSTVETYVDVLVGWFKKLDVKMWQQKVRGCLEIERPAGKANSTGKIGKCSKFFHNGIYKHLLQIFLG